jgi:hypothetical protein
VAEKVGKKVEETINVLLFWVERREKEGRTIVAPATLGTGAEVVGVWLGWGGRAAQDAREGERGFKVFWEGRVSVL